MQNAIFEEEEQKVPPSSPGFSPLPLLRTFKRKALLITSIAAIVTFLYSYIEYRRNSNAQEYSGSFQLLVEPLTIEGKLSAPSTLANSKGLQNDKHLAVDYPTMIKILTSTDMLSNIAEKVQTKYSDFSVNDLKENLTVARITNGENRFDSSKIIGVTYNESNPELVQFVLENAAQQYLDYSLDNRIQEVGGGIEFIEQQLPELDNKVARNLNEIQDLQEQYQMFEADTKSNFLLEQLKETRLEETAVQKEIAEQTQIKNNLETKLNISVDEAIAILSLRENPNYQELITQLKAKESQLAVASATFYSGSPQVTNLQQEIKELNALIAAETRKLISQQSLSVRANRFLVANNQDSLLLSLVEQLVAAANNLETLKVSQQNLAQTANSLSTQVEQFPQILRRYQELERELEIANTTREQLLVQRDQLQVQASQTQPPWEIVSQPRILEDSEGNPIPIEEDSSKTILKGLIAGLVLGAGTALLIEKIGDRFYTTDDVIDTIKTSPILGEIPFYPHLLQSQNYKSLVKSSLDLSIGYLPGRGEFDGSYAEFLAAFDKLYANIYLRYRQESINSIAVCSPTRGDGRSTIALNLAKQISTRGKKVLLVDENSFNYQLPDELVSVEQADENLFILIASQKILNDSEQREKLMSEFKASYDYVIYDTPPLLDSVTASLLSVDTDGILMVTAIEKTSRSSFIEAFKQVEAFKLPLLGIVTNHIDSDKLNEETTKQLNRFNRDRLYPSADRGKILNAEVKSRSESEGNSAKNHSTINKKSLK